MIAVIANYEKKLRCEDVGRLVDALISEPDEAFDVLKSSLTILVDPRWFPDLDYIYCSGKGKGKAKDNTTEYNESRHSDRDGEDLRDSKTEQSFRMFPF